MATILAESIKAIIPIVALVVGFFLGEQGKNRNTIKEDRKKLNKLVFYLLELRVYLVSELKLSEELDEILFKLKAFLVERLGPSIEFDPGQVKPLLEPILQKHITTNQLEYLENNADTIIGELAESFPIFAYELIGKYKIKDRLKKADAYFQDISSLTKEFPFDLKEWIAPKMTEKLLEEYDYDLKKIASRLGKKILADTEEKIELQDKRDDTEMEKYFHEYVNKLVGALNEQNKTL